MCFAVTFGCEGSEIVANLTIEESEATDPEPPPTRDTGTSPFEEVEEETDTEDPWEASHLGPCAGWNEDGDGDTDNVHEGDLFLRTQEDVERLYDQEVSPSHITGNLKIDGRLDGDIEETSFLNCIKTIGGDLIIENNPRLNDLKY